MLNIGRKNTHNLVAEREQLRETLTGLNETDLELRLQDNNFSITELINEKLDLLIDIITDEIGVDVNIEEYDLGGLLVTSDEARVILADLLSTQLLFRQRVQR